MAQCKLGERQPAMPDLMVTDIAHATISLPHCPLPSPSLVLQWASLGIWCSCPLCHLPTGALTFESLLSPWRQLREGAEKRQDTAFKEIRSPDSGCPSPHSSAQGFTIDKQPLGPGSQEGPTLEQLRLRVCFFFFLDGPEHYWA